MFNTLPSPQEEVSLKGHLAVCAHSPLDCELLEGNDSHTPMYLPGNESILDDHWGNASESSSILVSLQGDDLLSSVQRHSPVFLLSGELQNSALCSTWTVL